MEINRLTYTCITRCWLALLLAVFLPLHFRAQIPAGKCGFKNNELLVEINKKAGAKPLSEFINKYNLQDLDLKTVFETNRLDTLQRLGWKVRMNNAQTLVITKSLGGSTNLGNPADNIIITGRDASLAERFPVTGHGEPYGYNRFRNKPPFPVKDSVVTFFLRNHLTARRVMLAGSFNNFSPDNLRMERTDSGWIAAVKLIPGKYWYKFVADGDWMIDEDNYLRENDGQGNVNSVYYQPNFVFRFKGATNASNAYVIGSFNRWKEHELAMFKTATGWVLPIYLANGTHTYKFLIDGVYYNEAGKQDKTPDGNGGYNSVARLGSSFVFTLAGYTNATQVSVAGTFNNWRPNELYLQKTPTGWELPYALAAGNYQYKFIVDGSWIRDPANPLTANLGGETNSYLVVGANYTFRLKDAANAQSVFLAGDFNNWSRNVLPMKRQGNEWVQSVYLTPGKHKYKFIVDGNWITDPANANWEQNEFGTGNSVMWMEK